MPEWRDFLERFRPAGIPGAAARRGVPTDRGADAAAELIPLLALLDDSQDEASRIRSEAAARADEIRSSAGELAAAIVARARRDAGRVAAESEANACRTAGAAQADMRARTATEIERLRSRIAQQMPDYVDKVVAAVRQWLDSSLEDPMEVLDG
jgi:vacuolar-type H+-ATPase subunit E/Vma4